MLVKNISLKRYNTFGIDVKADKMCEVNDDRELLDFLKDNKDVYVIGGGSNILLLNDLSRPVVKMNTKGINIVGEDEEYVYLKVKAGEKWHDFVLFCVNNGWGGVENLSLIPGTVGAAPVQNIGAYGVEVKDVIVSCKGVCIEDLSFREFKNVECKFGYRDSVFKGEYKDKYVITEVDFKLKKRDYILKTKYGAIENELSKRGIKSATIKDVSDVVIYIRNSKLPNPKIIGNGGSFFKNPIIKREIYKEIQQKYNDIPFYDVDESNVKVPAGWLIENSGLKGFRIGDVGIHEKQCLVLVNYGGGNGEDVYNLSCEVIRKVKDRYGIELEREINIIK